MKIMASKLLPVPHIQANFVSGWFRDTGVNGPRSGRADLLASSVTNELGKRYTHNDAGEALN